MRQHISVGKTSRRIALSLAGCLAIVFGIRLALAQQSEADTSSVPLQTSINALMVALVDHSAHEIWEAGFAETLTGRDWQTIEQHAIQLVGAGTLISLPGTGAADRGWVASPAWQEWSNQLTDGALRALEAVSENDQEALVAAGDILVATCEGCHEIFKPDTPTEGIMHIPHYD